MKRLSWNTCEKKSVPLIHFEVLGSVIDILSDGLRCSMIDYCSAVIKNCHMALNVSSVDNYLSVYCS